VQLTGEAKGAKEGGVLSQVTREVNVEALPMEIPEHLELDITAMEIGDSLRVADLPPREGVTYLDDPETVLANVAQPRVEEEPEEAAEGEEGAVAEGEAPEGEAEAGAEGEGEPEAEASGDAGTTEG